METKERRSTRSLRANLRSPGRPPVLHRAERWPFWEAVAQGYSSEDAAVIAGVSQPVGTRWFRECGGMPPSHLAPSSPEPSGRYLSFAEREQIALAIARLLGRLLRRSHASCGATRPRAAVALITGPTRLSGTPTGPQSAQSQRNW